MALQKQSNSRQVPSVEEICADKKYYDILYSYFQCISVPVDPDNKDMRRIFPKKEVNFTQLGKIFGLSRQTVSTKFKNLKDLGLIEEFDENNYLLPRLEENKAALIPYPTLKLMTDTLSEHCVSTYIYLFNRYWNKE